jgi:small GTP-binding protein
MHEIPIVLIGHKDHGKSTLIGRLLLDTKSVKESRLKDVQEVDKAWGRKFELAHLVDSFKEEREREMTMDTTRVLLKSKKRNYQLIDVPGHETLISQMLTGASGAEAALLLVDIAEGIKEQTRQHLEIAKLLGIEQLAVAVNKMDKVSYQKNAFEEIKEELKEILNRIGYLAENIRFFPISAWEGDNLIKKSEKTSWYQGPTLMDFLENEIKESESFENLSLRFLVQDKYWAGNEEILIGRIESGKLKVGQDILFLPDNKKAKIQSLKDSEGNLDKAKAGQNIGLILSENLDILRGAVGALPTSPPKVNDVLSGEIFWIEAPSQPALVCECGTAQVQGKLQEPKFIKAKEKSFYKIYLEKPIAFDPRGKTILGKIVLKDKGKIIGIGIL